MAAGKAEEEVGTVLTKYLRRDLLVAQLPRRLRRFAGNPRHSQSVDGRSCQRLDQGKRRRQLGSIRAESCGLRKGRMVRWRTGWGLRWPACDPRSSQSVDGRS